MKKSQFETLIREVIRETIRKVDGKYVVYPEKGGKRLGTHLSKAAAEKQLKAIHINKEAYEKGKVIIYHNFQGVDADENIAGTNKVLNVADCIGNEPGKDYKYFTTEKKKYVEDMVKNAAGEGWKKFPPVLAIPHPVVSGKYSIIDGNHRLGAFTIGKIPQINARILSDDKILLAERGAEWDENKLPRTMPLADAKKKGVHLKEYFTTQPLKVPSNENYADGKTPVDWEKRDWELYETVDTDNKITVLSVIDGKRNLDNDQISQLFSDDVGGTFYIYAVEEGEEEFHKPVSKQDAYKYIDYYNARLKKDYKREEKLGAELGVLGIESELHFHRGEFKTDPSVFSPNENYAADREKEIANDILSVLNEGKLDGVLTKMKQYAKKGLLTLAVIASVTQGLQAQGIAQSDIDAVNQQGIELVQQNYTVSRMTERLIVQTLGQQKFDAFVKLAKENGLRLGAGKSRMLNIARSQSRLNALSGINGEVTTQVVDSKTMKTSDGQYLVIQFIQVNVQENYADGKVKGKSRPGRVKKAGASCKGSVTDLRAKAKKYGGEKGKMYHWCANMKSGRKK